MFETVRVTLEHLCESWKDSKTFQGLAALFLTPLLFMARTALGAPNLSLILFDSSVHTERTDKLLKQARQHIISYLWIQMLFRTEG